MNPDFLRQMQEMQRRAAELQKSLSGMEVEGQSGGGLVRVVLNGLGDLKTITIDPSLLKPEDQQMLQDLVVAACADGKQRLESRRVNDAQFLSELFKNLGG